jgi:hypothetical protein
MHVLGLTIHERSGKKESLYEYITSDTYRQHATDSERLTNDLLGLDADEKDAHDKVWRKRGTMATRLKKVLGEVETELSAILETR